MSASPVLPPARRARPRRGQRAGGAVGQDGGVQPRLEVLDGRLARLAAGAPGAVEGAAQLGLADVVLRPQPLLLQQPGRVVAGLAALAAVLARRGGAGREVARGPALVR